MSVVRKNVSIPKWMDEVVRKEHWSLSKILQDSIEEKARDHGYDPKRVKMSLEGDKK